MNNKIIYLASIIFSVAMFSFIMSFIGYKNYKKQILRKNLRRTISSQKNKEISLKDIFNIKFNKVEILFLQAGIDTIYIEDALLVSVFIVVLAIGSSAIFSYGIFAVLIPITFIGFGVAFLKSKASKRVKQINEQFCEALDDIGDDLRINRNLYLSIKNTLPTLKSPLKEEFELVCQNVESNIDVIVALKNFSDRIGTSVIEGWVDAIIFASEKQSNTADVCKKYNVKIRDRLRTNEKIQTQLKSIKVTSVMILFMLGGMIISFYSQNPEYIDFLKGGLGTVIGIYAAISVLVSTLFIFNKIDKEASQI